jgi:hypothetical protein
VAFLEMQRGSANGNGQRRRREQGAGGGAGGARQRAVARQSPLSVGDVLIFRGLKLEIKGCVQNTCDGFPAIVESVLNSANSNSGGVQTSGE